MERRTRRWNGSCRRSRCLWGLPVALPGSFGFLSVVGVAVTAVAKLVDKAVMGGSPVELVSGLCRISALVEQQDLGEIVAETCPRLVIGAGNGSRSAGRDGGRLGQLAGARVRSIADHVVAASRLVLQHAPE